MSMDAGTAGHIGTVDSRRDGNLWRIVLGGQWTIAAAAGIDQALKALPAAPDRRVTIDMTDVSELDTTGAWLVWRTISTLEEQGIETELVAARPAHTSLIDTVARNAVPCPPAPPRRNAFVNMVERVGAGTFSAFYEARDLVNFLGHVVIVFTRSMVQPHRIRLTPLISHIEQSKRYSFELHPFLA